MMASSLRVLLRCGNFSLSNHWLQRTLQRHKVIASAYQTNSPSKHGRARQYGRAPSRGAPTKEAPQRSIHIVTEPDHMGPSLMILKAGKSRLFYEGAPTIYGGAVDRIVAAKRPETGEAMLVLDANMKQVCWGVYNSVSMFCLRILQWRYEIDSAGKSDMDVAGVIACRVKTAVEMRQMIGLPSEDTTVFRLVNSEGDRLSGLTVDVYGKRAVASSSAAWIEANRGAVIDALKSQAGMEEVVWRPAVEMLKLEGWTPDKPAQPATATTSEEDGSEEGAISKEESPLDLTMNGGNRHQNVLENGVSYRVDLRHGQKTGFYADQRDSRSLIKSLAKGKRVLDLCTYTGGFALAAAAGGATEVTGVDSSASAVSLAEENAALSPETAAAKFEKAEVEPYMRQAHSDGRLWDIVVLDPPKLAPNKRALERAKQKYVKLNAAAMRLVSPGGLLMTCSCSGAVAQTDGLLPLVKEAAGQVGRLPTLLRVAGAALDHPLDPSYPEGQYLSNLLLRLD